MKKKYKIGILGYGGFGQFLHHYWDQLECVDVGAISDLRLNPDEHGLPVFTDWRKLIAVPDIDIISIATPPNLHAEMACAAMEQGKHVLIEKPVALSLDDAQKVIMSRDQHHSIATVDYMMRFNPIVNALKSFKDEGVFGSLTHVAVQNLAQDSSLDKDHWFWNKAVSGGILVEHAVHFFDLIYYISEQKHKKVYGFSSMRNAVQQDQVFASVQHENELISTHYHAFSRPGFFEDTSIRLVYDLAQIEINGWIPVSGTITALVNDSSRRRLQNLPGFKEIQDLPVEEIEDQSRPEGWGGHDVSGSDIRSRGKRYQITSMLHGTFSINKTKSEVYGHGVQSVLMDMIYKIEEPEHKMRITLEDTVESLEIAFAADISANAV